MNPRRRRMNRLHRKTRKAQAWIREFILAQSHTFRAVPFTFADCTCDVLPYCVPHAIGAGPT